MTLPKVVHQHWSACILWVHRADLGNVSRRADEHREVAFKGCTGFTSDVSRRVDQHGIQCI